MTSIAIVVSQFNQDVTGALLTGALQKLQELNIPQENIRVVKVPGAVEIPVTAKHLAKTGDYGAVICFGAVIYGETDHYDYVCQQVSYGCQRVALDTDVPVIFGVLTTKTRELALARAGGEHSNAGAECVDAALHMIKTLAQISGVVAA